MRSTVGDRSQTADRQVLSTPDRPLSLFISHSPTIGVPWRQLLSPEFGTTFLKKSSLIFRGTLISLEHSVEGNLYAKKSARSCSRFDTLPACDRHTDTRRQLIPALTYRYAGKNCPRSRIETRPSSLPHYHAHTRWTLPALLASAAPRRTPHRATMQLMT